MKKSLLAIMLVFFVSSPAYASSCPKEMAKIDAALKTAALSAGEKTQVQELRKKGEGEHKAGKHADSMASLGRAKAILKIQ
jgi:hypothetical protein